MKAEHRRCKVAYIILVGLFLGSLLPLAGLAADVAGLNVVNPSHGNAKIQGDDAGYHYFRVKLAADAETTLMLKQDACSLADRKGKKYSQCRIHIAAGSAGLSVTQRAPIMIKMLNIELEGRPSSGAIRWETSRVDGPEGALEVHIPQGGYVELDILWESPKNFVPRRFTIDQVLDITFPQ